MCAASRFPQAISPGSPCVSGGTRGAHHGAVDRTRDYGQTRDMTGRTASSPASRDSGRALRRFSAPTLSPALWTALWAAGVAAMVVVIAGAVLADEPVEGLRLAFRLVGGAFVACGLIAWRRRPDSRSGLLMTATGFLLFVEPLFAQFDSPRGNGRRDPRRISGGSRSSGSS